MTPADRAERKAHRDEITAAIDVIEWMATCIDTERPATADIIRAKLKIIAAEADALR